MYVVINNDSIKAVEIRPNKSYYVLNQKEVQN